MKMLLSGVSKGACALFFETALIAHRHGMLAEMIESYSRIYPGVMGIVERMMPTFKIIYAPLQLVIQWGVDSRSPWFEYGFFWYMGIWGVEPEIQGPE